MATMRRMAAALTAAMFAFSGFEAFATDGTWLAQPGVGTGGTNWAVWENPANWDGGIVADNGTATLPSSAVYVNSTNGVTLSMVTSGAATDSAYSVVRSDKTVAIDYASGYNLVNKVFLYSDWTWKCTSSYYVGASAAQICGDCTSFSGNMLVT